MNNFMLACTLIPKVDEGGIVGLESKCPLMSLESKVGYFLRSKHLDALMCHDIVREI